MKKQKTIYALEEKCIYMLCFITIILVAIFLIFNTNTNYLILGIFFIALNITLIVIILDDGLNPSLIPLAYILKYDFEYAIREIELPLHIYRIIIDEQRIEADDKRTIGEICELIRGANDISIIVNDFLERKIKKEEILKLLEKKSQNKKLKKSKLHIDIPIKFYVIRNSFLPNKYLEFYTYEDDNTFEKINKIPKKNLLKAIINFRKNDNLLYQYCPSVKYHIDCYYLGLNKYEWQKLDKNNEIYKESKHMIKEEEMIINKNYQKIMTMIDNIDKRLENGFVFSTISVDKWRNFYRQEILAKLNSKYELDEIQKEQIVEILEKLRKSMYDKNEKDDSLEKYASITAMKEMLKLDGIDNQDFNGEKI